MFPNSKRQHAWHVPSFSGDLPQLAVLRQPQAPHQRMKRSLDELCTSGVTYLPLVLDLIPRHPNSYLSFKTHRYYMYMFACVYMYIHTKLYIYVRFHQHILPIILQFKHKPNKCCWLNSKVNDPNTAGCSSPGHGHETEVGPRQLSVYIQKWMVYFRL